MTFASGTMSRNLMLSVSNSSLTLLVTLHQCAPTSCPAISSTLHHSVPRLSWSALSGTEQISPALKWVKQEALEGSRKHTCGCHE